MGSIEKQKSGYEDLIILDQKENISELLYSNIFWIKKEVFYTPSLLTGCVKGVMRSYLIDRMQEKGIEYNEISASLDILRKVDHVFATNAAGIISITGIDGIEYEIYPRIVEIMDRNG